MCNQKDGKDNQGDEDMSQIAEIRRNLKSKNHKKKIPHLNTVDGKVIIDSNDPKQVKWFEEFKK